MKSVLPLAVIGAMVVSPAFAAGGMKSSESSSQSGASSSTLGQQQSGMQDQQTVMQIQEKLKQQGYDVGPVDGIMGPNTKQALMQFQQDKGIQGSGTLDQQTAAALGVSDSGTQQSQMPSEQQQIPGGSSGSVGSGAESMGGSSQQQQQGQPPSGTTR